MQNSYFNSTLHCHLSAPARKKTCPPKCIHHVWPPDCYSHAPCSFRIWHHLCMCGNSCCKLTVACESFCAATLWNYKQSCSFSEPLWGQRHHFRSLFGCRNRISKFWFAEIRLLPINVLLTERWGWKKGCGSHSQGLFVLACDTLLDGRIIQRWVKKKKYLNKWHICWGEVQPSAESPPLRRPAVLMAGMCTHSFLGGRGAYTGS